MTPPPPPPANVFRSLAVGVALFGAALLAALFGVRLEAVAPAGGQVIAGDQRCVRLEIDERRAAGIAPGQPVRIESTMYPLRVHGKARGTLTHIEPAVIDGNDGRRVVVAIARVDESPFDLLAGATVTAEIVTGRKRLVRIILEY